MEPTSELVFNILTLTGYFSVFLGTAVSMYFITRFLIARFEEGRIRDFKLLSAINIMLFGILLANGGHFSVVLFNLANGQDLDTSFGPLNVWDWFQSIGHFVLALAVVNLTILLGAYRSDHCSLINSDQYEKDPRGSL